MGQTNLKRILRSNGPVSTLRLDGLVIPMNPDLTGMIYGDFQGRLIEEAQLLGDEFLELAMKHESRLKAEYPQGNEDFIVPPGSAHLITGHKTKLAKNLIYVCSVDLKQGEPFFDNALLKTCIESVFEVANVNYIQTLGIPPITSIGYHRHSEQELIEITADVVKNKLKTSVSIKDVYLFCLPKGHTSTMVIKTLEQLN